MIDIIVPVYNVEKYLAGCITSVCNQNFSDWHLILVDDGSTDSSGKICDQFAEKDAKISVIHKPNGGLSSARNAGLDCSQGDFVLFLDSDDTLTDGILQTLYDTITQNDVDAVFGGYNCIDENGNLIGTLQVPAQTLTGERRFTIVYDVAHVVMACGKLFRKKVFEGFKFREGKLHEDVFAYHELAYHADKICYIDQPVINYLQRRDSIMGKNFTARNFDAVDGLFERANFFEEKHLVNCTNATIAYIYMYLLYIVHRINFDDPNIASRFKEYYTQWEKLSHSSHWFSFRLICFLYQHKCLKKPLMSYKPVAVAMRVRRIFAEENGLHVFFSKLSKKIIGRLKLYRRLTAYFFKVRQANAILLDTPIHSNLGDHAIEIAEEQLLKENGLKCLELTGVEIDGVEWRYAKLTPTNKLVCITGGGSIGSLWPTEDIRIRLAVQAFSKNRVVIFPQTVTYDTATREGKALLKDSKIVFSKHPNLTIFVREKRSAELMQQEFAEVSTILVPDIVMRLSMPIDAAHRNGILLCLRSDKERAIDDAVLTYMEQLIVEKYPEEKIQYTSTVLDHNVAPENRYVEVQKKLDEFAAAKLVVTDRLHGMIFATITNTPCIALSNSNGKVKDIYDAWLSGNHYIRFVDSKSAFENALDGLDLAKTYKYDQSRLAEAYAPLVKALK